MLILGVHPGYHDAAVVLCDDYRILAAVQLERLTRRKIDGGRVPNEAIEECVAIAGVTRGEVDVVTLGRAAFPWRYYSHFRGGRWLEGQAREIAGKQKHKSMERELIRAGRTDAEGIFNAARFRAEHGFRDDVRVVFFNHHLAHALPTLFHTDWDSALLYTSDGGGDNVQYSHRVFREGRIETLYGDDACLLQPLRIDSLGMAYGYATQALGYRINRHEGKLTGLAAFGEPTAYDALAPHFSVDERGEIHSDFESYPAMRRRVFDIAAAEKSADMAASMQKLLEDFSLGSVKRLLQGRGLQGLGLAGGVFGNVRLNQRLAEETGVEDVFVYPAMSDSGLAAGGVLAFLLERDGLPHWLDQRYRLETLYFERNYDDAADAYFAGDSRVRRISDNPIEDTAAGWCGVRRSAFTSAAWNTGRGRWGRERSSARRPTRRSTMF